MKSWKTTLGGILLALGLYGQSEFTSSTESVWFRRAATIIAIVGAALTGVAARDFNVSSEKQGLADRPPGRPPASIPFLP